MTSTDQIHLRRGRIPWHVLESHVREWIEDHDKTRPSEVLDDPTAFQHYCGIRVLAENIGCHESTLRKWVEGRRPAIAFDYADRLLVTLNLGHLWQTELSEYYYEVAL